MAGGMPLAFTQEDFLVVHSFYSLLRFVHNVAAAAVIGFQNAVAV